MTRERSRREKEESLLAVESGENENSFDIGMTFLPVVGENWGFHARNGSRDCSLL